MNKSIVLVASFGVIATAPAFAGSGAKSEPAAKAAHSTVPASSRTTEFQFNLDKTGSVSVQQFPQDLGDVFAARNEVKLENYSFILK